MALDTTKLDRSEDLSQPPVQRAPLGSCGAILPTSEHRNGGSHRRGRRRVGNGETTLSMVSILGDKIKN